MDKSTIIPGTTKKPEIIRDERYVIVGSVDHGKAIPMDAVPELVASLEGIEALMMEAPERLHKQLQAMSTEVLAKASAGNAQLHYLSGNGLQDIGEQVLEYAPRDIAELFVPCVFVRNCFSIGSEPSSAGIFAFTDTYTQRFGFLDVRRTLEAHMKVLKYWADHDMDTRDLDHFSYDFEKFLGDIREFEFWQPELRKFREQYSGKIGVCVGGYHIQFVQDMMEGKEVEAPDWETHFGKQRENERTPIDPERLDRIYADIEKALND